MLFAPIVFCSWPNSEDFATQGDLGFEGTKPENLHVNGFSEGPNSAPLTGLGRAGSENCWDAKISGMCLCIQ